MVRKLGWIGSVTALVMAVSIGQAVPSALAENTPNDSSIQAELTKSLSNTKRSDVGAKRHTLSHRNSECLWR
jgi:hypothetical protein